MYELVGRHRLELWTIREYLDIRGQTAKVRANREKALFSHIYNKVREWGYTALQNPCQGVKGFRETGRSRCLGPGDHPCACGRGSAAAGVGCWGGGEDGWESWEWIQGWAESVKALFYKPKEGWVIFVVFCLVFN